MNPTDPKDPKLIHAMGTDPELTRATREFFNAACRYRYSYNFSWLGVPVIQFPQDLLAMQEIVWKVRPGLIVETGVAHGGSLVFYASLLELLGSGGMVAGIDVEIRQHNREVLEKHPLFKRIQLIEGSSTSDAVVGKVRELAHGRSPII